MIDHGVLTQVDIDIQVHGNNLPSLGPNFHSPDALLQAVDHYSQYNALTAAGAQPLNSYLAHSLPRRDPMEQTIEQATEKLIDEMRRDLGTSMDCDDQEIGNYDGRGPEDLDNEETHQDEENEDDDDPPILVPASSEDDPDPFKFETSLEPHNERNYINQPPHLLVIYALATWLHLQFHLPRVACNAFLAIMVYLLTSVAPQLASPFVTLQSATRFLGLDAPTVLLPVCPGCRDVYPPAGSLHTQDSCLTCSIDLFLPDKTQRGNNRSKKIPCVKYPYLPLSQQIHSLLAIPGLEDTLDQWRVKPRTRGQYTDIFDGEICRSKLKAPDGTLFFSNKPVERQGPSGELWIGLNLDVDWLYCYPFTSDIRH